MAGTAARLRRTLAEERGFSFPELIVAMMVAMVVAGGAATLLIVAVRAQPPSSERSAQIQQGRTLIESVSRELRQGETVHEATASTLTFDTYANSVACGGSFSQTARLCRVSYSCEAGTCVRNEFDAAGVASTREVATGLLDDEIFSYCQSAEGGPQCGLETVAAPTYVGIEIAYPKPDGGEGVTFNDGTALRNYLDPVAAPG